MTQAAVTATTAALLCLAVVFWYVGLRMRFHAVEHPASDLMAEWKSPTARFSMRMCALSLGTWLALTAAFTSVAPVAMDAETGMPKAVSDAYAGGAVASLAAMAPLLRWFWLAALALSILSFFAAALSRRPASQPRHDPVSVASDTLRTGSDERTVEYGLPLQAVVVARGLMLGFIVAGLSAAAMSWCSLGDGAARPLISAVVLCASCLWCGWGAWMGTRLCVACEVKAGELVLTTLWGNRVTVEQTRLLRIAVRKAHWSANGGPALVVLVRDAFPFIVPVPNSGTFVALVEGFGGTGGHT